MIEYFPDPFPDEVLYSVWARFSDLANYPNLSDVFKELFGNRRTKPIADLPCQLGHFFEHLPYGHSYTIDLLIDRHTLLPFYAPFLPAERYIHLREQMISKHGKAVQRRAGSVSVRVPVSLWLRYCPACVEQDRANFGECYWHRLHQVPGVEVCPIHALFLENSTARAQSTFARNEFISAGRAIRAIAPRRAGPSPLYPLLRDIALDAAYLLEHPFPSLGKEFLRKQYAVLLARNNFMTQSGEEVRCFELTEAFANYYPAELLNLFNCEVHYAPGRRSWLTTLTHRPQYGYHLNRAHHPLHHLLAIRFLGATVEEFLSHEFRPPCPFGRGPWPCLNPVCDHYQQNSILSCQISEPKKGRYQGTFVCNCGFTYSRYNQRGSTPSLDNIFRKRAILSYGATWEAKLRELWFDPTISFKEISRQLKISVTGLKYHAIELHLPLTRDLFRIAENTSQLVSIKKDRSWYRSHWLNLLKEHPAENVGRLQERSPLVYKWLLHNDREWLDAHRPPGKLKRRSESIVREIARTDMSSLDDKKFSDVKIADAIKSAAHTIRYDTGRPKRITTRKIKTLVPEVIPMLGHPDKIPQIIRVLQEVIETREAFAVRRVQWIAQQYLNEQVFPSKSQLVERANLYTLLHIPQVQHTLEEAMAVLSRRG